MQKVGIIGLGYVGLPTAIGFLDAGFEVWVSMFHSEVERKPPPICYEADLLLF
jgi:3-hydroxyisobutyrate dehydrogenase-like beta-hydroxyacid dehydrogenase